MPRYREPSYERAVKVARDRAFRRENKSKSAFERRHIPA